jgi:hypothetical protein
MNCADLSINEHKILGEETVCRSGDLASIEEYG